MQAGVKITWSLTKQGPVGEEEVIDLGHNEMTTAGLGYLVGTMIGDASLPLNNSQAVIGVGDANTAFSASHTDLQAGANKVRRGMEPGFPSRAGAVATFRAAFGASVANFPWQEWGLFSALSSGTMISRRVQSIGTKPSGTVWTLTATLTLS